MRLFLLLASFVFFHLEAEAKKLIVYNFAESGYENIFQEFTSSTGIEVEINHDSPVLLLSNLRDPQNPDKPDLVIHQESLNFADFARQGFLTPIRSSVLEEKIPASLRDLSAGWVGLSYHARTIVTSSSLSDPPKTYEELADPKWKGKLCLRKATYPYTRSLISSLLVAHGPHQTENILRGWVSNNEKSIFVGDLYVLQAIERGECSVALVNSDFFYRYTTNQNPNSPIRLIWANQEGRGANVNIAGMGLLQQGVQREEAIQALEFLATHRESLIAFADQKKEFPTVPGVDPKSGILEKLGRFKLDQSALTDLNAKDEEAKALAVKVNYNP